MSGLDNRWGSLEEKLKAQRERKENKKNNTVRKYTDQSFTLEKKEKLKLQRKTYYLTQDLIENIDAVADESGYDKSEIVRIALQTFFDNIEIEKK